MTAISDKLKKAGYNTTRARLRVLAEEALRKARLDISRAVEIFEAALRHKRDLVHELERFFVEITAADMRGGAQVEDGGKVHAILDTQNESDSPPSSPPSDDRGQAPFETHGVRAASPPPRGPAGQNTRETQPIVAPAREASPAQRQAAIAQRSGVAVRTLLDTRRIAGKAWGDVTFGELEIIRLRSSADSFIARQLQKRAIADAHTKVRDVVNADEFERMVRKASELADAL